MKTVLQERRLNAGVSLRELARAMGPGFSRARINFAERGIIQIPTHEQVAILEAINRLAPLSGCRKRIIETAREIDFAEYCGDIRRRVESLSATA